MITLHRTNSDNADFRAMVTLLDHDLKIRDGEDHSFYAQFNTLNRINHALVAYNEGIPVGSGAIRQYNAESIEVKRMFVKPQYRGMGIAGLILKELEAWAGELHFNSCILETGKKQPEAISLYQKAGYSIIPNYGQYQNIENSVCMKKELIKQT